MLSLNSDIIWTIISLLTEEFPTDDASKSIRNCSQVCQFWRHLILDSPSIWGKLINLNDFRHSNDRWMEEVLRRSGSCLLWVSGRIQGRTADPTDALQSFFFSILNDHWDRIQKIEIIIDHFDEKDRHNWRAIYRPAPYLQVFSVNPPPISPRPLVPLDLPCLFADHAPSLRAFNMKAAFPVSPKASWLSALRIVHLHSQLKLPQILDALGTMHLLESLTISLPRLIPDFPTTHAEEATIHLPNLSQLCLFNNFSAAMRVITALQVPPGCSFRMHVLGGDIITELIDPLLQLTHNYFQFNRPKKVWLISQPHEFMFRDYDRADPDTVLPFFSVHILSSAIMTETIGLTYAVTLPSADMSSVTHLHVISDGVFARRTSHEFFLTLASIKTITITEDMISYLLLSLADRSNVIFPLLRIIRIKWRTDSWKHDVDLRAFLEARKAADRPILVLDVPK
ncbi:hypothetical protein GALMADRAFT_146612 [Galerina marginata CBS 339.88]|uniref:F-box domain-containing protein n=1 Tax=Galerina marginata (strain CBS 339.88) TaxID=685588 RepID=A0A067SDP9_GALM3|nr:hypothetical protein GALMADRAFT_146612 [Galerina marginata CBS 339.88]